MAPPWSLSRIVTIAWLGLPSTALLCGLLMRLNRKVSAPSARLSLKIGTSTVLVVSPAPKVSVPIVFS
jgi:hypothetical protein